MSNNIMPIAVTTNEIILNDLILYKIRRNVPSNDILPIDVI